MTDCAASIRAADGSSSDLLTSRGLTAIYIGAADNYIKQLVRVDVSQRARIYINFVSAFLKLRTRRDAQDCSYNSAQFSAVVRRKYRLC